MLVDNPESGHQVVQALESIEGPRVKDQRSVADCKALPHAGTVSRLEHLRPHTGVDGDHPLWLDTLVQNERAQLLCVSDDFVTHPRNHVIEEFGKSGGEHARTKKII